MSEKLITIKKADKKVKEQNIMLKVLRLLAEEQLITIEEELKGEELIRKELGEF